MRLEKGSMSHCLIFTGPEGIGKKQVACWLAYHWLRNEIPQDAPKLSNYFHPDLFVLEPDGESFKKAQVEKLIEDLSKKPFEGYARAVIIDDFHKATPQAQNALLKTMEEPGVRQLLIGVTHKAGQILPTVQSRSQIISFKAPGLSDYLEHFPEADIGSVKRLIQGHRGNVSAVINGLEKGDNSKGEMLFRWLSNIGKGRRGSVYPVIEKVSEDEDQELWLQYLASWFEDLISLKVGDEESLNRPVYKEALQKQAKTIKMENIQALTEKLERASRALRSHVNTATVWENLLDDIQEAIIDDNSGGD
ncbi:MAG: DNA polymerase III subunit [Tissierellia bacterium]|nr:DNA polymerase III subunit [Tissierellia bacterium]